MYCSGTVVFVIECVVGGLIIVIAAAFAAFFSTVITRFCSLGLPPSAPSST
jgi:hypothetical protein